MKQIDKNKILSPTFLDSCKHVVTEPIFSSSNTEWIRFTCNIGEIKIRWERNPFDIDESICNIYVNGEHISPEYYNEHIFRILITDQIGDALNGVYSFSSKTSVEKLKIPDESLVFVESLDSTYLYKDPLWWLVRGTGPQNDFDYEQADPEKVKNLIGVDTEIFFEQLDEIEVATTTATVSELRSLVADLAGVTRSILHLYLMGDKK